MNLVGPEKGLFSEEALKVLYNVGNQVAVAMERARLFQHLETLVEERTAKLAAEVEQRKCIQEEQARLVAIIEATPDFIGTSDLRGNVHFVNQAGLDMLGYRAGEDTTALRVANTYPEWAAKLIAEQGIPHAIEHGSWSAETAVLNRDGREVPVSQVIIAHRGGRWIGRVPVDNRAQYRAAKAAREAHHTFEPGLCRPEWHQHHDRPHPGSAGTVR